MLLGTAITGCGILLTTFMFLLAGQNMGVVFLGFTLFGIGLGFYATPWPGRSTGFIVRNIGSRRPWTF